MPEPPALAEEAIAGAPSWFLKVRAGAAAMPGAAVPAYLHRHGVPLVLAPLPTGRGAPFVVVDRFALALYPLLDAATGAEVGLSPAQWRELGAAVRQAHTLPPTPALAALAGRGDVPAEPARAASRPRLLACYRTAWARRPGAPPWKASWTCSSQATSSTWPTDLPGDSVLVRLRPA